MKIIISLFVLLFIPSYLYATDFQLIHFNRYGGTPNMELGLLPKDGYRLSEIFKILDLDYDELNIRLIGNSSIKTNSELSKYYKKICQVIWKRH